MNDVVNKPGPDGGKAEKLIEAIARDQDRAAFEQLFAHYAPRIKTLLVRQGTPPEIAEDLAQEAMLIVWRKATYFAATRGSASAWIYTIARNLRIDNARRSQRAELYAMMDDYDREGPAQPDEIVSSTEHAERVQRAMAELPEEQLEVVKLSFVEGAAHAEIAERLDLPLGTVKSRLRLAMRRLRKSLEDLS